MGKRWFDRTFGFVALVWLFSAGGCAARQPAELRVATLNIAHGRRLAPQPIGVPSATFRHNLESIARLVLREHPDIVALQEIDDASVLSGSLNHLRVLGESAKYPYRLQGIHADTTQWGLPIRYGTALLSRQPLHASTSVPFHSKPLDTKGFVAAEIDFAGQRVLVVSVHLDFKTSTTRMRQIETLIEHVRKRNLPVVLMGDINCQWKQGSAVCRLTDRLGLQAMSPDSTLLSTYPAKDPRRRLDWILISPELEFRTYTVWPDIVSDHRGVAAALRWRD